MTMQRRQSVLLLTLLCAGSALQANPHEMLPAATEVMEPAPAQSTFDATAFQQRYKKAGSPRTVIYFNRELSDNVDEWDASQRVVASFKGVALGARQTTPTDGHISLSVQHRQPSTQQRHYPEHEPWRWAFEQTIQDAFLDQGVKLVDRTLMLRQTAAKLPDTGTNETVAAKRLEMEALDGQADLLVEMVVLKDSEHSYQLKATTYNVKNAQVVAVTRLSYQLNPDGDVVIRPGQAPAPVGSRTYVATDRGYEVRQEQTSSASDLAHRFANQLLDSLAQRL